MHTLKKFTENIGWLIIGTIISNIISIIVSIVIIRKLKVEDYGIYSLFIGSLSILSIFSINGILLALRRFIPEIIQKQYFSFHKSLIIKLYFISLIVTFIIVLIVFQFKKEVGVILNINQFEVYYSIFIINIFLYLQTTLSQDILSSLFEQKFIAITSVLGMLARGVLYSIFFTNLTIDLIFIIEALCIGVRGIPSIIYLFIRIQNLAKHKNSDINAEEKKVIQKRISRYALLSTANEIGEGGFSQVSDYYFISAFLGPFFMGLYAFPYRLLSSIFSWVPIEKINNIFKPYFINKYYEKNEDPAYLTSMFNFLFKIYFLFFGMLIVLIISYQKLINIYLFNSKYLETQLLLAVVLFFYIFNALGYPTHIIIEVKEKIEYTLYAKVFAVFNVLAVIFVLKFTDWNLLGVALATGISKYLRFYYLYLIIKKMSKVKILLPGLLKSSSLIIISGIFMFLMSLIDNLFIQLILPMLVGIILFLVLYRLIKPFNNSEEILLSNFLNRFSIKMNVISKILALQHS